MVDVKSEVAGRVWQIVAGEGETVAADDPIVILESMKMEMPIEAPADGVLREIIVAEGDSVQEGQVVAKMDED